MSDNRPPRFAVQPPYFRRLGYPPVETTHPCLNTQVRPCKDEWPNDRDMWCAYCHDPSMALKVGVDWASGEEWTAGLSWETVQRAALHDPVLHRLVTLVSQGIPREDALIATVLFMSEEWHRRAKDFRPTLPPLHQFRGGKETTLHFLRCIKCGRREHAERGQTDMLTQPNGRPCGGKFY